MGHSPKQRLLARTQQQVTQDVERHERCWWKGIVCHRWHSQSRRSWRGYKALWKCNTKRLRWNLRLAHPWGTSRGIPSRADRWTECYTHLLLLHRPWHHAKPDKRSRQWQVWNLVSFRAVVTHTWREQEYLRTINSRLLAIPGRRIDSKRWKGTRSWHQLYDHVRSGRQLL